MNPTIALVAILTASLLAAPAAAADQSVEGPAASSCEFLTIGPVFPYVLIDWSCPPIAGSSGEV